MKWEEMVDLEPELERLYRAAKSVDGSNKNFCANMIFYEEIKPVIECLVGWGAQNANLRTSRCYDVAYKKIYKALPPCKDCLCL